MITENLHIVVCIKLTPSTQSQPGQPAQMAISALDEYALEEGVRIKERLGGKAVVTCLAMGTNQSIEMLRDAIARGATGGALLSSPDFEGSDSLGTATVLSLGIRKLSKDRGPVDLVLFGKQSSDTDMGQVGPQVAALLDIPNVAFVRKISEIDSGRMVVERMMEDGVDTLEMDLPAAASVLKEINEPRLASLKGKMAAKKMDIPVWGTAELGADPAKVGKRGSLLAVGTPYAPPKRSGGVVIAGTTPQEKAKNLVVKLKELKLV